MSEHEHKFIFLRQEVRLTRQWGDRVHERVIEDVFYCERCTEYLRKPIRREQPDNRSFGWVEVPL
jgi:hypothetical protein